MKILVLSPYLPHRRVGHGGGTAVRDLVTWLARDHQVSLAAMVRPYEQDLVSEVEALGVKVLGLPFLDDRAAGADRLALAAARGRAWVRSVLSGHPLYVEKYWSLGHSRRILEAGIIEPTPRLRTGEGRPARLYRYRPDAVAEVKARRLFP